MHRFSLNTNIRSMMLAKDAASFAEEQAFTSFLSNVSVPIVDISETLTIQHRYGDNLLQPQVAKLVTDFYDLITRTPLTTPSGNYSYADVCGGLACQLNYPLQLILKTYIDD